MFRDRVGTVIAVFLRLERFAELLGLLAGNLLRAVFLERSKGRLIEDIAGRNHMALLEIDIDVAEPAIAMGTAIIAPGLDARRYELGRGIGDRHLGKG